MEYKLVRKYEYETSRFVIVKGTLSPFWPTVLWFVNFKEKTHETKKQTNDNSRLDLFSLIYQLSSIKELHSHLTLTIITVETEFCKSANLIKSLHWRMLCAKIHIYVLRDQNRQFVNQSILIWVKMFIHWAARYSSWSKQWRYDQKDEIIKANKWTRRPCKSRWQPQNREQLDEPCTRQKDRQP